MAIEFMKGQYKIQKYAIEEYLYSYFFDLIYQYTIDQYELPKHTCDEGVEAYRSLYRSWKRNYNKDIFANEKVAKRFLKELESHFAYNGLDSFAYTCRYAAENTCFYYVAAAATPGQKLSKDTISQNATMVRIFNPLLSKWSNDMALLLEDIIDANRKIKEEAELMMLEQLTAKHGRRVVKR